VALQIDLQLKVPNRGVQTMDFKVFGCDSLPLVEQVTLNHRPPLHNGLPLPNTLPILRARSKIVIPGFKLIGVRSTPKVNEPSRSSGTSKINLDNLPRFVLRIS
jgi:hypothetical protein